MTNEPIKRTNVKTARKRLRFWKKLYTVKQTYNEWKTMIFILTVVMGP